MKNDKAVRAYLRAINATSSICIGRSSNRCGVGTCTPIKYVRGEDAPRLKGQPYLKTNFSRGSFSKTLYTPSTLYVEVGENWCGLKA